MEIVMSSITGRRWMVWVVTGSMAGLMLLSAVPDVLRVPDALMWFRHLGYPAYLLPFLGTAKILGVVAVLMPGFPRVKEWAFAGLTFDVTGAAYSHLSSGDSAGGWGPPLLALVLIAGAYAAYRVGREPLASESTRAMALAPPIRA
jgi:hypothetical protein